MGRTGLVLMNAVCFILVVVVLVVCIWRRQTVKPPIQEIEEIPSEILQEKPKRAKERRRRGKDKRPPLDTRPLSPRLVPLPPSPVVPVVVLPPIEPAPVMSKPKLPAFPPASPLPPSLARKPPPIARTATLTKPKVEEKPKKKPERTRKQSDKKSATPESTQIASLKGALEAARLREEEVAEERKAWQKRERELQTQVNQLSHQLHALTIAFATGGGQGFPPYGYNYAKPEDHYPMTPMPMPQPYLVSPWHPMPASPNTIHPMGIPHARHWHGSPRRPLRGTGTPSTPSVGSVDDSVHDPFGKDPFVLGQSVSRRETFSSGGSTSSFTGKDTFSFTAKDTTPLSLSKDTYFSTNTDDTSDYIPLRDDYVPTPPPPSGIKREREETESSDEDSGSDSDDSVIFEDGSVGSLNLSLREKGWGAEQEVM